MIDALIVARGAEHAAIRRGMGSLTTGSPDVLVVPMGANAAAAVTAAIAGKSYRRVVIIGLCGLLDPHARMGDAFVFEESLDNLGDVIFCDAELTAKLAQIRGVTRTRRVVSWTNIVTRANDKRELGALYFATAVDLESYPMLAVLRDAGIAAAVIRVGSDDALANIPDLNRAVRDDGSLDSLRLAFAMAIAPFDAVRLIRGSTRALKRLEHVTRALCA